MNPIEQRMLDMLRQGRDRHGVTAVKTSFDVEGSGPDEFHRLLDLARRAELKVSLRIGGSEAVADLQAARLHGVDHIVAPMVETAYSLAKFIEARAKAYGRGESDGTALLFPEFLFPEFLFKVETDTTLRNIHEMIPIAQGNIDGIVFGRVDFARSRGLSHTAVEDREVTDAVLQVARRCADADLVLVVGGSAGIETLPVLREIRRTRLDRFETGKLIFDGSALDSADMATGIALAAAFETAWQENRRDWHGGCGHHVDLGRQIGSTPR